MPWSDDRLAIAFAARASVSAAAVPPDLLPATMSALAARPASPIPVWRRLLAPAAVLVVAIGVVVGGAAMLGGLSGPASVVFRDAPTPALRTLDAGEFAFDFPVDWRAYDASSPYSGGSSIAVLGTQPVEPRCGDANHVDINCVYEQPLEPGDIRVFIGTWAYRGDTILDRPGIENGTSTRLTIGGMPAILDAYDPQPDSFYQEDVSLAWEIAFPRSLSNVVRIEVRARGWPFHGRINTEAEVREAVQVMADSFRFTPPPTSLASDPAAATTASLAAIQTQADGFRSGYVSDANAAAVTYLECLGQVPATPSVARVRYGPGGDLGGQVDLTCTWTVGFETPSIWRVDTTYDWTVADRTGRYTETYWIDAASVVLASTFAGEPPPSSELDPGDPGIPETMLGLAVITVTDALAIRDAGVDDRELAVSGWFTPAPVIRCPPRVQAASSPLQSRCEDLFVWLTEAPDSLVHVTTDSLSTRPPVSAALNPDLDGLALSWVPPLPQVGDSTPVEVVMVGHFDDRRASLCPEAESKACRDRFVVDRVAWADGVEQPLSNVSLLDGVSARSSLDEVLAVVANEAPDSPVLSVVTANNEGIGAVEPELVFKASPGADPLIYLPIKWIVRVLESKRISTYVVWDGTDTIFEMTQDGGPVQVGGSVGPTPSPAPWPHSGSVVVELTSQVGAGMPPAQVAVVDRSGRLVTAGEKGSMDPDPQISSGEYSAYPEPGLPGRVHLAWQGGVCDSRITVTIAADLGSITLDMGPQPPCDAIGIGREVVLDFSGVVDVPSIQLLRSITTID